jgi:hypothetical protein
MTKRLTLIAIATALIAMAISASSADAATTRAEWVAQVDPICQNGQAQEAIAAQLLFGALRRAKKHPNRKTSRRADRALAVYFFQYANIERAVNTQIATIPPAPDDVSLVQVWLRARAELLDLETRLITGNVKTGKGLKGFTQAFSLLFELFGRQQEVTDLVRDFGFQHCSQPQSDPLSGLGTVSPGTP